MNYEPTAKDYVVTLIGNACFIAFLCNQTLAFKAFTLIASQPLPVRLAILAWLVFNWCLGFVRGRTHGTYWGRRDLAR